jgi:CelD/BcsL family acetyltransferase involved in cellulose biosynthesis
MDASSATAAEPLRLEPIVRLEEAREDWERLALATGQPFATWEWNRIWWRRFGAGRQLYSFSCRDDAGAVRAILPLYVALRRPLTVARFLGYADYGAPLCAPADASLTARAMRDATRAPHPARLIFAERLPGDWGRLLGGARIAKGPDLALPIEGRSWDDILATRSRKPRSRLRRAERRLVEDHGLTFRLASEPDRLPTDMDALFRLHAKRWGEQTTGVFDGARQEFHREFAGVALENGWLRLWFAEIDGEPVAAWYGWRFAGADWHYQGGRDPSWDRFSVGTVLMAHTIRSACEDEMDAYRFLAGAEEYKYRFGAEELGTETRLVGSWALTHLGRLALAMPGVSPALRGGAR